MWWYHSRSVIRRSQTQFSSAEHLQLPFYSIFFFYALDPSTLLCNEKKTTLNVSRQNKIKQVWLRAAARWLSIGQYDAHRRCLYFLFKYFSSFIKLWVHHFMSFFYYLWEKLIKYKSIQNVSSTKMKYMALWSWTKSNTICTNLFFSFTVIGLKIIVKSHKFIIWTSRFDWVHRKTYC